MRLLLISHEFTITGASTVLLRLATYFQGQGHEVSVFPVNPADGPVRQRYAALEIPILSELAADGFDLAIGNGICAAPALLKLPPGLPALWIVHEAEIALNLLLRNPGWIEAFKRADAVVYQTNFQQDVFRSFTWRLPPDKFHIVPNGVEVALDKLARDKVPAKTRRWRAIQVGTMEPRKRPGDFIRAVAMSGLDMEAVICGKFFAMDKTVLELTRTEPEKYRLLENLPDEELLAWVESADMFCLASVSETQGLSVYEAALLARPLLLSDLPCYRDIFRHGHHCLMFPPGHVPLLALSMRNLAMSEALRTQLGEGARQVARSFTNERFFRHFQMIIDALYA